MGRMRRMRMGRMELRMTTMTRRKMSGTTMTTTMKTTKKTRKRMRRMRRMIRMRRKRRMCMRIRTMRLGNRDGLRMSMGIRDLIQMRVYIRVGDQEERGTEEGLETLQEGEEGGVTHCTGGTNIFAHFETD